jgi:hypothetical protein
MQPWNLLPRKGISHFGWVHEHKFCRLSKKKQSPSPNTCSLWWALPSHGQAKDKTPLLYLKLKLNIMPSLKHARKECGFIDSYLNWDLLKLNNLSSITITKVLCTWCTI